MDTIAGLKQSILNVERQYKFYQNPAKHLVSWKNNPEEHKKSQDYRLEIIEKLKQKLQTLEQHELSTL